MALAGFSGVVVVFGSRSQDGWHPGDRLRLSFLLESSFTAGALSLIALILLSLAADPQLAWMVASLLWAAGMTFSLATSSKRLRNARREHPDTDDRANRAMLAACSVLIVIELVNAASWRSFGPLLAGLVMNLFGACTQFGRLIQSAFRE